MVCGRVRVTLILILLLAVSMVPLSADSPYRLGVLRGPTAVAFAPVFNSSTELADGRPVEIAAYPDPPSLIAAYIGGEVDSASLPSNAAAQLSGRGVGVEVAATFIWGVLYLVGPAHTSLGELRGPVHSIGRGASPDILLRYILDQEGLASVIRVEYGYAQVELAQLLIAGRVDAGVLPEPFVTRVLRDNRELGIVADLQERFEAHTGSGVPQTVLVVRPGDPAAPEITELLRTSVARVLAEPDRTAELVAGLGLGLDEATARSSLPRLNLRVASGRESRPALERYLGILYDFEPASVGGRLPPPEFYGE